MNWYLVQISAEALVLRHQVSVFRSSFPPFLLPPTYFSPFLFNLGMSRTTLIRRIATQAKMPSLRNLPSGLLLNVVRPPVHDIMALSQQSRGIHALCNVKNRQKYHQLKFGREKLPQTHGAVLQAGLDTLLAILRFPSLGDYLRRVDLYGTGMIEFTSDFSTQNSVLSPEDINRLKQAILGAGFQNTQERESILFMLSRNPANFE